MISQIHVKQQQQFENQQIKKDKTRVMVIENIKKIFLVIVGLTCFTCFQRADYNLPLFAFAYFLWDYKHPNSQRTRLYYLFIGTWIVDFIWLIYWGVTWSSSQYKNSGEAGSSTFVMVLSIISFLVKLGVIIILFLMEQQCRLAIKNFLSNLKSIVKPNQVIEQDQY